MGHKKVCFNCRKAFSIDINNAADINLKCPECGVQAYYINHKFRPPKQNDIKKWKVAEYLKDNGFFYDLTYEQMERGVYVSVPYPTMMEEATEFVKKYNKWLSPAS